MRRHTTKGRGTRPGLSTSERGSVTVEAAGALMAMVLLFCILVSGLAAFGSELALTALARDAVRAAAIQTDRGNAELAVQRVLRRAEGVRYQLSADGEFVAVRLEKSLRILRFPAPMTLFARASSYAESPW